MAYTQFKTLESLKDIFGIEHQMDSLFDGVVLQNESDTLKIVIETNITLPTKTEKAKSELLVSPILVEIIRKSNHKLTLFSGENLNADKALGLNGECDFVISKNEKRLEINDPILQIIEAKRQDFDLGVVQCSAQMIGARIFNEKHGNNITKIYGCVTTGTEWLFLKLDNNLITIDNKKYYLQNLPELLGVFQMIIDEYKDILD